MPKRSSLRPAALARARDRRESVAEHLGRDDVREPAVAHARDALERLGIAPAAPDRRARPSGSGAAASAPRGTDRSGPSLATGSPDQSRRRSGIASESRAPRSCTGTPQASYSRGNSPPTPTPKISRPSQRRSSVATCFATGVGWRSGSRIHRGAEEQPLGVRGRLRQLQQRIEDRHRERDVVADPERVEAERLGEPHGGADRRRIRQRRDEPVTRFGVERERHVCGSGARVQRGRARPAGAVVGSGSAPPRSR